MAGENTSGILNLIKVGVGLVVAAMGAGAVSAWMGIDTGGKKEAVEKKSSFNLKERLGNVVHSAYRKVDKSLATYRQKHEYGVVDNFADKLDEIVENRPKLKAQIVEITNQLSGGQIEEWDRSPRPEPPEKRQWFRRKGHGDQEPQIQTLKEHTADSSVIEL